MSNKEDRLQGEEGDNAYWSPIKPLFDKFAKHKDVTLIYGEPIQHGKQTMVPVAKINYSFGAGGGSGTNSDSCDQGSGHGEGSGGHITVKPLGVYQMTKGRVRFKPAIDVKFIVGIATVLTLGMSLLLRKK